MRVPALLRPRFGELHAGSPRTWGEVRLGERLRSAGVRPGLGCEGAGYLGAAAARVPGACEAPGAT